MKVWTSHNNSRINMALVVLGFKLTTIILLLAVENFYKVSTIVNYDSSGYLTRKLSMLRLQTCKLQA